MLIFAKKVVKTPKKWGNVGQNGGKIPCLTEKNIKSVPNNALYTILAQKTISIWAMPEQFQVEELVRLMREAKYSEAKIIDCLSSIIKTQMIMGGTLTDKLDFYKFQVERSFVK